MKRERERERAGRGRGKTREVRGIGSWAGVTTFVRGHTWKPTRHRRLALTF